MKSRLVEAIIIINVILPIVTSFMLWAQAITAADRGDTGWWSFAVGGMVFGGVSLGFALAYQRLKPSVDRQERNHRARKDPS